MLTRIRSYLCLLTTALCAVLLLAASVEASPPGVPAGEYEVERIIDGDTIVVLGAGSGRVTVRYLGVDTPEAGEPFYNAAKARNSALLASGRVEVVPCASEPLDRYGRLLAWVYSDGVFVNGALAREGLARSLIIPPCGLERADEIRGLEKAARSEGAGLWGGNRGEVIWGSRSRLETLETREAAANVGRYVRVRGSVSGTHKDRGGLYIHFHTGGPMGFSAVILASTFKDFPPELLDPGVYRGRTVAVVGVITDFVTRSEIVVSSPSDIEIER